MLLKFFDPFGIIGFLLSVIGIPIIKTLLILWLQVLRPELVCCHDGTRFFHGSIMKVFLAAQFSNGPITMTIFSCNGLDSQWRLFPKDNCYNLPCWRNIWSFLAGSLFPTHGLDFSLVWVSFILRKWLKFCRFCWNSCKSYLYSLHEFV